MLALGTSSPTCGVGHADLMEGQQPSVLHTPQIHARLTQWRDCPLPVPKMDIKTGCIGSYCHIAILLQNTGTHTGVEGMGGGPMLQRGFAGCQGYGFWEGGQLNTQFNFCP